MLICSLQFLSRTNLQLVFSAGGLSAFPTGTLPNGQEIVIIAQYFKKFMVNITIVSPAMAVHLLKGWSVITGDVVITVQI